MFGELVGTVSTARHCGTVPAADAAIALVPVVVLAATPGSEQIKEYIGSGPYKFVTADYKPGEKLVYVKNDKYKPRTEAPNGTTGGKVVYTDRVEWIVIRDPQTQFNALIAGEVDIIEQPAFEQYASLKAAKDVQIVDAQPAGLQYIFRFNHLHAPFDNVKIRQAAMVAMGQEAFLKTQVGAPGMFKYCKSIFPCGTPYASDNTGIYTGMANPAKAKQMLADTRLPVSTVALASGFASLRRFNAAFAEHYGLNPTQLRRAGASRGEAGITVRLGYRPPYDVAAMLGFFRKRGIAGIEQVSDNGLARTLAMEAGGRLHTGWLAAEFDQANHQVVLRASDSLSGALPRVIGRVRAMLDLDADPAAIGSVLHARFPEGDGLRVPGALSGYELAVRAVLGQQITVAAARTLAQRMVDRFGEAIETPLPELRRLFPQPAVLAQASGDALGQLGIVKQRQAAIVAIARAVDQGHLQLHSGTDVQATMAALRELPGIGDWTAQYIAMRALRWPDAFPAGDVALQKALGVQQSRQPAREALAASLAWAPWRSYAVVRAWAELPAGPSKAPKSVANSAHSAGPGG